MSHRIKVAASLVSGLFLCLFLVVSAAGCDPEADVDGAGDVDQPSPMDWQSQNALMTAPSKSPRTIAAMMFDIGSGPPTRDVDQSVIGGTGTSQRHMFQEISYGIQDTQPEYFGPFTLPVHNCLTIACCGPSSDKTGNGATVQSEMDALGKTFNHYFWVYGALPAGADCGTWGDEGSPNSIAKYSSYSFHQIVGYAQEIGHNFGMTHEPTMCCGGTVSGNRTCAGGTTFSDNTATCQHMEYANSLSFMGGGAHHPSAVHKYHQGWMSGCNLVKVGASATITLLPQELPCDGAQLLQIPAPKSRPGPGIRGDGQGNPPTLTHYYLEMRAPLGFDSGVGPMVLVSIGPDLPAANRNAPYVYLLDTNPGTTTLNDAGLRAGGSYSNPSGGFTVTVNSIDNASANVTITTNGTGSLMCGAPAPRRSRRRGPDATSCGPLFGGGTSTGVGGRGGGRSGPRVRQALEAEAARQGAPRAAGGAAGTGVGGGATAGTSGSARGGAGGVSGSAGTGGSAATGTGGGAGTGTGGSVATGTGATGGSSHDRHRDRGDHRRDRDGGHRPDRVGRRRQPVPRRTAAASCETAPAHPPGAMTALGLLLGMVTIARRRSRRAPMG